jgi:hypothetical protein
MAAGVRVGLADGKPVRVLREDLEKIRASITNLEADVSPGIRGRTT